jgi:exonuclease III
MASEPLFARGASCEVLAQFGTSDHAPVVATFAEETATGA